MKDKVVLYDYLAEKILYYCKNGSKFQGYTYQKVEMFPGGIKKSNTFSYDLARWVLSRYNVPKELQSRIINEMIEMGLIKRHNKRELEVTKKDITWIDMNE